MFITKLHPISEIPHRCSKRTTTKNFMLEKVTSVPLQISVVVPNRTALRSEDIFVRLRLS